MHYQQFMEVYNILEQLFTTLAYLEANQVIHRDLKPENMILNSSGQLKLIDFGNCRKIDKRSVMTMEVGTHGYKAPELRAAD